MFALNMSSSTVRALVYAGVAFRTASSFVPLLVCPHFPPYRTGAALSAIKSPQEPFGRQDYWQGFYEENNQEDFSWYATWQDMEPFVREWVAENQSILLPGVGTDSLLMDMYAAGFTDLSAFDYAPESTKYWKQNNRWVNGRCPVDVRTADARDLPYANDSFAVVLDKGTYDAVFLAGNSREERLDNLETAIKEVDRVLSPENAVFWSLSAICTEVLLQSPTLAQWNLEADGSLYMTEDGYASNNLDGTLLVWTR